MTQATVASETHDFVLKDIFEVQDEVGRQVVASLRRRFPSAVPKDTRTLHARVPRWPDLPTVPSHRRSSSALTRARTAACVALSRKDACWPP